MHIVLLNDNKEFLMELILKTFNPEALRLFHPKLFYIIKLSLLMEFATLRFYSQGTITNEMKSQADQKSFVDNYFHNLTKGNTASVYEAQAVLPDTPFGGARNR